MNPNINLMHLKFFCDAIIYESISEAAKMNFISQLAVSQAIARTSDRKILKLTYRLSLKKKPVTKFSNWLLEL